MPPSRIFIVPYRDREPHKRILIAKLNEFLSDQDDWELFFIHQCDSRPFNRGAMKNLGFLAVKRLFLDCYRDITLIFHDVDTWPRWKDQFRYQTHRGVVAHYYGAAFALGGIVAIKAGDFENTGGFPNFWGWGLEDNALQDRCIQAGLHIDRSQFYTLQDRAVARGFDGFKRVASRPDAAVYKHGTPDTFHAISRIKWRFNAGGMVDVYDFHIPTSHQHQYYAPLDVRQGSHIRAEKRFLNAELTYPVHRAKVPHPVFRGRKRIKAPPSGIIRRWPSR